MEHDRRPGAGGQEPLRRDDTTAPAPGAPDSDGDGSSAVTGVWTAAVENRIPFTVEPGTEPEPADEPGEQPSDVPTGEPETTASPS